MSNVTASRIKAACSCGKKYLIRPDIAGRRVRCRCGSIFAVPLATEPGSPDPTMTCRWCDNAVSENQQVCDGCKEEKIAAIKSGPVTTAGDAPSRWWNQKDVVYTAWICGVSVLLISLFQMTLIGPYFLLLYLFVAIGCAIGLIVAKSEDCSIAVYIMVIASFELIGAIRYSYGLSRGMRQFDMLEMSMLFGPVAIVLVFFLITTDGVGARSGWTCSSSSHYAHSCSSSSCGSSCGGGCGSSCGGGCGGGGCGGCGG